MKNNQRHFVNFAEETHPLLQELPLEFRRLWFHTYHCKETGDKLILAMERIYQNTNYCNSPCADLLTFEIADMENLLEWDEEYPNRSFVAIDPSYIFFDKLINKHEGLFYLGDLDKQNMNFIPQLEISMSPLTTGLVLDFQDGTTPLIWQK